jgi:aminoglycoside 3-N-acetyltransferase
MWSEDRLIEDLRKLGLYEGAHVLAHVSMGAVGPGEEGAATLLNAFRRMLGHTGTLLVPAFTPEFIDPGEGEAAPEADDEIERIRAELGVFDASATPVSDVVGAFSEAVRQQPDARRSAHPVASYAAIGAPAGVLTERVPFHYPLGSESPVARLHRLKGWVVLIGVGQEANSALHLAEVWADAPYIHRSARVKTGPDQWTVMQGGAGCTAGFPKIVAVLRQARILHTGQVGGAPAQLMRLEETVSMAVAVLRGSADALLCDDPNCRSCRLARKYTAGSTYVAGRAL